jgi:hypothetical protein
VLSISVIKVLAVSLETTSYIVLVLISLSRTISER